MWRATTRPGKIQKNSSLGPVSSCQSVQILAKMYKFLAKMNQNVPFPCHGQKNVNQIPPQELLGRKNLIFLSEEFSPCPDLSRQTVPLEKNAVA